MSRKKILQIPKHTPETNKEISKTVHFDMEDSLLSLEHYGTYLMTIKSLSSNRTTSRIYVSYVNQSKYNIARKKRGDFIVKASDKRALYNLHDWYPDDIGFIDNILKSVMQIERTESSTFGILKGLGVFLRVLKQNNIKLYTIDEINSKHNKILNHFLRTEKNLVKKDIRNVKYFLKILEGCELGYVFPIQLFPKVTRKYTIEALPSNIIFQISYYAEKEIKKLIKDATEYNQWIIENKKNELFSLKNLAYTYYTTLDGNNQSDKQSLSLINIISNDLYDTDLKCWKNRSAGGKYTYYNNKKEEKRHQQLKNIAIGGKIILLKSEKMFALWHKEIYPNWPHERTVVEKYENCISHEFRYTYPIKIGFNIDDFDRRIYPKSVDIYPLIVFILIWEGMNAEVLKNWKIYKNKNARYCIGDETAVSLTITSKKTKTNKVQTCIIPTTSQLKKYIDFYLLWLTPMYEISKSDSFIQFVKIRIHKNFKGIREWSSGYLTEVQNSKKFLLKKYNIFDNDGKRITHVDHRTFRVYDNYKNYLKGYSEFQRQMKKGHTNINTQLYYENSKEWKNQKKHKIARAQEATIKMFLGEIDKNEQNHQLKSNGPLADCIDNRNPTNINLDKNEICTDWFACLTKCDKSRVIPKIHGAVIYAWKLYMEDQKKLFYNENHWNKEYFDDYNAAESVLNEFDKLEILYAKDNAYRHIEFVKRKFKRKVNTESMIAYV